MQHNIITIDLQFMFNAVKIPIFLALRVEQVSMSKADVQWNTILCKCFKPSFHRIRQHSPGTQSNRMLCANRKGGIDVVILPIIHNKDYNLSKRE